MIVHLVSDRFSVGGGMEHMFQIVRGLPGIGFRIYARSAPESPGEIPAAIRKKFMGLVNVELDSRGFAPEQALEGRPDLIHIHHLRPLYRFYRHPFKKYTVPVVFTVHGLHIHKFEFPGKSLTSVFQNKVKYRLRFLLEKNLFSRPDRVIAVSREDRDFIEKKYGLKSAVYLTNGIELTGYDIKPDDRSRLRKSLNLPEDSFLFVTVARFDFQKGYDFLVRVMGRMKGFLRERRVGFIFVGNGPEMKPVKHLAERLQVSRFVFFLGEIPNAPAVMKSGDAFLLPSRWEGLPIVLLECGLLRLPVIASDTYGNREIISSQNGVLFENLNESALENAIRKAVTGGYDFKKMTGRLYREVRSNYSLEQMISGVRQIYHALSASSDVKSRRT